MKLRNAAYLAMFLYFARKTISKMSPDSTGRTGRWIAIYPYANESAIVGSFNTQQKAEEFKKRLREYVRCRIDIECLDDWKGHSTYYKFKSVFDFMGCIDHWPQVPHFAESHGQNRMTTDPTEANEVMNRWRHR